MARATSELAEIASIGLHVAEAEIMAVGDPESILWALDQIRQAGDCLKLVMAEDFPPDACESPSQNSTGPRPASPSSASEKRLNLLR